jgi:HEAT repeat protein
VTLASEASVSGLWKLLPGVRPPERASFLFFLSLSGLIFFAQTIGLATAEALFLARVGVAHLPLAFVLASGVAVAGSLAYAAVVGRRRNDLLFVQLLLLAAGTLLVLGLAVRGGLFWAPFALLCVYYLAQAVFLNHFWTFAGDYFDILATKRLFPLFQIGSSLGGVLGGATTAVVVRLVSPEILLYVWVVALALAAGLVGSTRSRLRRWYPVELEERDESSVEGLRVAARFLRRSTLGRTLIISTVGLMLVLFLLQYLYSAVFVRSFPHEAALATFLGAYLAITSLLEIGFEGFVTPRLIRRLGVGSANLVHPVLTLLAFGLLAVDPRLYAGVLARVNREMLDDAMAAPVRVLVQNALPARLRGKIRAFLDGMVVHAGMVLAGGVLILLGPAVEMGWVCAAGAAAALLYLGANLGVRRAYLTSLVAGVRSGRVDLREQSGELGKFEIGRLVDLWGSLAFEERQPHPSPAARQLARLLARRRVLDPLVGALSHDRSAVRRAAAEALSECPEEAAAALAASRNDPDAEVRLLVVRAWPERAAEGEGNQPLEWLRPLLADPDPRVRAEAARHLGSDGESVLARMALAADPAIAESALRTLPPALVSLAVRRADDNDPRIRAAALQALSQVGGPAPLDLSRLLREFAHSDAAVRCAAVAALSTRPEPEAETALASALGDPAREVRHSAALQVARLGERGVELATAALETQPIWAAEAAFLAIAQSGASNARPTLASQLRLRALQAWTAFRALKVLPVNGDLPARFLRAAYEDALIQNRKLAFRILELLADATVVRTVEKVLLFGSGRLRAEALEVLSHLGDREAAHLLVLTLEQTTHAGTPDPSSLEREGPEPLEEVLAEARRALNRWIRIAGAAYDDRAARMEANMERLLALRNVSLFSQMSLDQLEAVNGLLIESQFVSGEVVFWEGDPGKELYLITEGAVDVVKDHGTDRAVQLAQLGVGSCVGEIAVVDQSPRTATAVAAEDSTLLALGGDRFKELIYDMPELAFAIFGVLTDHLRRSDARLQAAVLGAGSGI